MSARDAEIVRRLRERCAAKFGRPVDYPFFLASYLDGEDPDAALLRLFRRYQQVLDRTDDDVIAAMITNNAERWIAAAAPSSVAR